jgi:hypothetical protein
LGLRGQTYVPEHSILAWPQPARNLGPLTLAGRALIRTTVLLRAPKRDHCLSTAQPFKERRIFLSIGRAHCFPHRIVWLSRTFSLAPILPGGAGRYRLPYGVYAGRLGLSNKKRSSPRAYSGRSFHRVYTIGTQNYGGKSHALYKQCEECRNGSRDLRSPPFIPQAHCAINITHYIPG